MEKSKNGYPLVTEGYFGAEVEVLCLIKELSLYLVRIRDEFHTYHIEGEDGLSLSSIDPDDFRNEIKTVKLSELESFVKAL